MNHTLRVCKKCGRAFPATLEYFPKNGRFMRTACRPCHNAGNRVKVSKRVKPSPEVILERQRRYAAEYRKRYPEKVRAAARAARVTEKGRIISRVASQNRRARQRQAGGTFTRDDLKAQYERQRGLCWWCSRPVGKRYHADHLIPLAKGGSNGPGNIVIACPECNHCKKDRMPLEFAGRLF